MNQRTQNGYQLKTANGSDFVLPLQMFDTSFYLKSPVVDGFRALQWDVGALDQDQKPIIDPNVEVGVFNRALLRKISLYRRNGDQKVLFAQLFAKVHHPMRHAIYGYRGYESLEQRVNYESEHLRYWNIIGLPSPFYFGTFEHPVTTPNIGEPAMSYTVLMTHVSAPTHDLDFIVLNDLIERHSEALGDKFRSDEEKRQVSKNIVILQQEKQKIVESIMDAQIRTQLLGTYHLGDIGNQYNLVVREPKDYIAEEHKIREHYLRVYYLYNLVEKGEMSVERARSRSNFQSKFIIPHKYREDYRSRMSRPLQELLTSPLEILYADKRMLRYVQGDEFPWHYAYKFRRESPSTHLARLSGADVEKHSVMFDANNAKIALPEEGLANILYSHFLDLTAKEIENAVDTYYKRWSKLAHSYANTSFIFNGTKIDRRNMKDLLPVLSSPEELLDRVQAMFILSRTVPLIGVKGKDRFDGGGHNLNFECLERPYEDSIVDFPTTEISGILTTPTRVNYRAYSANVSLPALRERIRLCIDSFLSRQRSSTNLYKSFENSVKRVRDKYIELQILPS